MKKIHLEGIPSTISAMEWIRANDCPWISNLEVYFGRGRRDGLWDMMISSLNEVDVEDEFEFNPLSAWYDYEGMKRLHCEFPSNMWIFYIDGSYYYATI